MNVINRSPSCPAKGSSNIRRASLPFHRPHPQTGHRPILRGERHRTRIIPTAERTMLDGGLRGRWVEQGRMMLVDWWAWEPQSMFGRPLHRTLRSPPPLKPQACLRLRRLGLASRTQEAEAQVVEPIAWVVPEPTSRTQIPRGAAKTPTAYHARRALARASRVCYSLC